MKIGLFGGSFNPVHNGHIYLAKHAIKELQLDELIFIPCYKSVDKSSEDYADILHRINMLLQSIPNKCSISTFELNKPKGIQTIEVIRHFCRVYKDADLFFLMGDDLLDTIETWESWEDLDKLAKLAIFNRSGFRSSKGLKLYRLNNEIIDVSSKEIRNKQKISYLPASVEVYIRENKLYGYFG